MHPTTAAQAPGSVCTSVTHPLRTRNLLGCVYQMCVSLLPVQFSKHFVPRQVKSTRESSWEHAMCTCTHTEVTTGPQTWWRVSKCSPYTTHRWLMGGCPERGLNYALDVFNSSFQTWLQWNSIISALYSDSEQHPAAGTGRWGEETLQKAEKDRDRK